MTTGSKRTVCVTGAGGFIASSLVQQLLENGYHVRGTVRSPDDEWKNGHLKELEGAKDRLTLVKADLLEYDSLFDAMNGCTGVFHTACPVPSHVSVHPEVEVLDPAIKGTLNVLRACFEAKIKRVVVTSSVASIYADPNRPTNVVLDESCWSDRNFCRENKHWYMLGKTLAEQAAWKYVKESNLNMVVICPSVVLGPLLQPAMNASSKVVLRLMNGSGDTYRTIDYGIVDVRDVAKAHILVYETSEASGRYICNGRVLNGKSLVEILRRRYPNYNLPTKPIDEQGPKLELRELSSKKLLDLGFSYIPIEQTLVDTVSSMQEKGFLQGSTL